LSGGDAASFYELSIFVRANLLSSAFARFDFAEWRMWR
jgi:hypothetical protein